MNDIEEIKRRAIALYNPPFRFDSYGYVWDSEGRMVADNHIDPESGDAILRVRGWGRIGYMDNAVELQDAVGTIIAEALTSHWERQITRSASETGKQL